MLYPKTLACLCIGVFVAQNSIASTENQRAFIAAELFGIPLGEVNAPIIGAYFNYNSWGSRPEDHKPYRCDAYGGGHSGIDIQTMDVAGPATADRLFYSLSMGKVIKDGGDSYNTIAIYDERRNISTIYLHARRVDVSLGQDIVLGQKLGVQGSKGAEDREHVHFEARIGKESSHACGASDSSSLDPTETALSYFRSYLGDSPTNTSALRPAYSTAIRKVVNGIELNPHGTPPNPDTFTQTIERAIPLTASVRSEVLDFFLANGRLPHKYGEGTVGTGSATELEGIAFISTSSDGIIGMGFSPETLGLGDLGLSKVITLRLVPTIKDADTLVWNCSDPGDPQFYQYQEWLPDSCFNIK